MIIDQTQVRRARRVADAIIKRLRPVKPKWTGTLGTYQNGRERGFSITVWPDDGTRRTVTFAENRNSDDLVVYLDNTDMQGLSEAAYRSGRYFQDDARAARYATTYLLTGTAPAKGNHGR